MLLEGSKFILYSQDKLTLKVSLGLLKDRFFVFFMVYQLYGLFNAKAILLERQE